MSIEESLLPPPELRRRWIELGYWREITLRDAIQDAVSRRPDCRLRVVASDHSAELDLRTLVERGQRAAGGLGALGLGSGDIIAIQMPNWAETWIAYTAAIYAGLVVLPIVPASGPSDLRFTFEECRPKAILTPTLWRGEDQVARLASITGGMIRIAVGEDQPSGVVDWRSLEQAQPCDHVSAACDDIAFLIYTSGTTGSPKGVLHNHRSLLAELAVSNETGKPGVRRILATWPPGHVAGLLTYLRFAVETLDTVLLERWNAQDAARLIEEERITSSGGTAFHLAALLDVAEAERIDVSSLWDYRTGGSAVPPQLVDRSEAHGVAAFRSYGLSEHPTVAFCDPADPLAVRAGTDGRLSPGSEVRVLDREGRDLAAGMEGEIVSRGPEAFVGYFRHALDAEAILPGGWIRTGDLGRIDEHGLVTITGRLKELIIRGGENISPTEVEEYASQHPSVTQAAAVGVPDERLGERVGLFVVTRDGRDLTVADFDTLFRSLGVSRQKTPEIVFTVEDLPRTPAGKVQKHLLRERFAEL